MTTMVIAAIGSFGYKVMFFLHILSVIVAFAPAFVNPFGTTTQGWPVRFESNSLSSASDGATITSTPANTFAVS